jgi:hypothetical protein
LNVLAVVKDSKKAAMIFFYQCLESVMQRTNKRNTTYMGMAFLFLSLTLTPLSLESLGVSPNLTAGVDAWRQISSVFGDSHQPETSSELLAMNSFDSGDATSIDSSNETEPSLLAEAQPEAAAAPSLHFDDVGIQPEETVNHQRRCCKSADQPLRVVKRIEFASVINPEIEIQTQAVEPSANPVVVINKEHWKKFEKHLSQYKFDINEAVKLAPMKEIKVMIRLKGLSVPFIPGAPKCDLRKALLPEQARELKERAMRARAIEQIPTVSENCEL